MTIGATSELAGHRQRMEGMRAEYHALIAEANRILDAANAGTVSKAELKTQELEMFARLKDLSLRKREQRARQREYTEALAIVGLTATADGDEMSVTGNTYDVRKVLKKMGGTWDAAARAWRVPRERWESAARRAEELGIREAGAQEG